MRSLLLPVFLLLPLGLSAQDSARAGWIQFEQFTLPNGLQVIYSEDHSTPIGVGKVMTVTVAGVETVTVPAGTFTAYRLELEGMQLPVVIHVSTTTPRRVLRISPTGAPIVFQLVK
ncbi:MAG: hypothetical protein Q8Q14_01345 [Gemmatimonadales bacterium]|nr:hypothetical protein [Gemmatimonadales bacterium]